MSRKRMPWLALGLASLLLAACSASSAEMQSAPATPTPTSSRAPAHCPNPDGGPANRCLGPLDPGTYSTSEFTPKLTYTVPSGWANYEDLRGQVLLLPPGAVLGSVDPETSDYIGIYRTVAAPLADCLSRPDMKVDHTSVAYADWLQNNPALNVTTPVDVTVGSLAGKMIDVELSPDATNTCSDPVMGFDRFVEVMIGQAPADFSASVTPDGGVRLYLLDMDEGVLAVLVAHAETDSDHPDFRPAAQAVIDTFSFALAGP